MFSSGYTANLGAVVALSGPGSLLISDAFAHASLVDACRLSRARVVVTPHNDVDVVEAALAARDEERALVVTDSVFSTDGALAPLRRLHEVCRRHRALLLVDEAHGLGVRGTGGRGLLHEGRPRRRTRRRDDHDDVEVAGQPGRWVLAPAAVRDHLIDAARTFIFDTGLTRRPLVPRLRPGCAGRGTVAGRGRHDPRPRAGDPVRCSGTPESAVVSVILGDPDVAVATATACLDAGVRVGCFRPPTFRRGPPGCG